MNHEKWWSENRDDLHPVLDGMIIECFDEDEAEYELKRIR